MGYILNNFRTKKIKNRFLITTDHGSWVLLNERGYDSLLGNKKINHSPRLYNLAVNKGVVLTEKNRECVINDYRRKNLFLFNGASLHIVTPTLVCNQKCIYCHSNAKDINSKGYDMDKETAKKITDFIFQSPSKAITIEFQGGEPLINFPVIQYFIEYAEYLNKKHKKDLRFSLVTNLTMMDSDILKYIIQNKIGLCTSLDGPKIVHDKNRRYLGGKSSYEDVVRWIDIIKNQYGYRIEALMVTTRFSLPYYKEIIDEYIKRGFGRIMIKFLNNLGFAQKTWNKISYTSDEFLSFWRKSVDYTRNLNGKIYDQYTIYLLQKILTKSQSPFVDLRSPCGAAISQLAYDHKGDIFTCDEGRQYDLFKIGNVSKNSYRGVLTSNHVCSIIAASTNDNFICDACVYKPYCGVCPVCSYAETGNIIPKLAMNFRCRVHKGMFDYIFGALATNKNAFSNWPLK